jgi:hypothetical protein
MIERMEYTIEREIRRFLDFIGLEIKEDTPVDAIQLRMNLLGLEIKHYTFPSHPEDSGWFIYKQKELIFIISDPWVEDGKIKFTRRVPS